jgi:hypothetical protein
MTDIVERLRACHGIISGDPECCCEEAAAEIERLRAQNADMLEALRTAPYRTPEMVAAIAKAEATP